MDTLQDPRHRRYGQRMLHGTLGQLCVRHQDFVGQAKLLEPAVAIHRVVQEDGCPVSILFGHLLFAHVAQQDSPALGISKLIQNLMGARHAYEQAHRCAVKKGKNKT